MKKLISLLFLCSFLFMISCKDPDAVFAKELYGKWYLTSILDANSGIKKVLPKDKKVIVEFKKDGIILETYENTSPNEFGFTGGGSTFNMEDDTSLRIINSYSASQYGNIYLIKKMDTSTLILEGEETGNVVQFLRK